MKAPKFPSFFKTTKNKQFELPVRYYDARNERIQTAIDKANKFNFSLEGAVMASDAFFPFPDCVEIASKNGIQSVIQPGGSIKDQLSIDSCNVFSDSAPACGPVGSLVPSSPSLFVVACGDR